MSANRRYAIGLFRAAGGAIIFGLPLLMTMEMWWLGFTMDRGRLLLLTLVLLPTLALLSYHAGFEQTFSWRDDVLDTAVAYGVGFVSAGVVLWLLSVWSLTDPPHEIVGKIAVQAVPAALGAMLARSLLSGEHADVDNTREPAYLGEIFIMGVGALFLSFSVAPTEEVVLIAYRLTPLKTLALMGVCLLLMHGFVYAVEFRGQESRSASATVFEEFLRLTVVGYAVALLMGAYVLWTFGRADDLHPAEWIRASIVLGLPASVGAAAARLIL